MVRFIQASQCHRYIVSSRIYKRNGVPRSICVCVDPAPQPDRIALDVPSGTRIVISEVVVVEASLGLIILAREPQIVGYLRPTFSEMENVFRSIT